MIKIVKISMAVVLGGAVLFAGTETLKRYDVESGKIDYKMTSSTGNSMFKIKKVGKKRVIFTNYGTRELIEENEISKTTMSGRTEVVKRHEITYMDESIIYTVDLKDKRITRTKNQSMQLMSAFAGGKSPKQLGEEALKAMGGKKLGTEKVLGYTCDIWEAMGIKQCIYKGIPLKIERNIMSQKSTEVATHIEFNIVLSDSDFKLPDYPIYDMYGKKLDKDMLANQDITDKKSGNVNAKEMQDGMKAMAAAMGALKASGFDMNNPNAKMTKSQKKSMQDAAMTAMGGEDKMLAQTKKEILDEAKDLPEIKKCFQDANSVKEANICEKKADREDPEHHTQWNNKIKSKLMQEITAFKKALPCIEKASSFAILKQCMP